MSAQAGIWNFDGKPADVELLKKVSAAVARYGHDGETIHLDGSVGILHRPFHTTFESRFERQPYLSARGLVITWDGRLDNREDLLPQLELNHSHKQTDVAIVTAAFERWGTQCFRKLVGDWAFSIWDPSERALILAKDYMGSRHLYYHLTQNIAFWCTYLSPIVRHCPTSLTIADEYVAGYLAMYPKAHLTPYREIQAVPPGSFVTIRNGKAVDYRYWSFEPNQRIRYRTDEEYEEHFRHVLRQSIRRRLRSDSPILGELSGGLDSTSIVCVADDIIAKGDASTPRLDTVSIYDPMEPGGGDLSYFTRVEQKRGRLGHHFDSTKYGVFSCFDYDEFMAVPGSFEGGGGLRKALLDLIKSQGYRVILSGTGGDEFLGGIPNPLPQLADLIVLLQPIKLYKQLVAWSLIKKRPWIQLLFEALSVLLPVSVRATVTKKDRLVPWIAAGFDRRHRLSVAQFGPSGRYGYWLPSRRDYAQTLTGMRRQLSYSPAHLLGFEERRFPYLDQTLIEFLLAIPAGQLLRPGQRRSLMRRALVGLVPQEILSRRTKANGAHNILVAFQNTWPEVERLFSSPLSAGKGYVSQARLKDSLRAAKNGDAPQLISLVKALYLEIWLRGLEKYNVIKFNLDLPELMDRAFARQEG